MERMTEAVADSEWQSMQHFLSNSPWEHQPVQDQIARDCDRLIGGSPDTGLIFDETGIPKKGKMSVGVARQWCGRLGKTDNCQTAVFGALSMGPHVALIDERLYLPEEWTKDKKRCKKAGVPDDIEFKTKSQLVHEMVRNARARRIRFTWLGFDGGYGKEPAFLNALEDDGEVFMADVHKDQSIYLEDPAPHVPEKKGRGRTPTQLVAAAPSMRVDKWIAEQPEDATARHDDVKVRIEAMRKLHLSTLFNKIICQRLADNFAESIFDFSHSSTSALVFQQPKQLRLQCGCNFLIFALVVFFSFLIFCFGYLISYFGIYFYTI